MTSSNSAPQQSATGKGIAQAIGPNASAIVNYYELAQPEPVNESQLAAALAKLAAIPVDAVPDLGPLPHGSRMLVAHNPLFVGRQDALLTFARTLKGGAIVAIGQTAAATGLGGIGKTQLVVEFAHRYGRFFAGGVFWLSFASAESVPAEVVACGGAGGMDLRSDFGSLKQDEQVGLVLSRWQDGLPRLLVFDNCESQDLLVRWRPPSGACRVLVTTRRADWDPALGVQAIPVDALPRADSMKLLHGYRPDLSAEGSDLDAIAGELGDLPLALDLAGNYLHRYAQSPIGAPAKLLAELRRPELLDSFALTGVGESQSPTKHELSVARTFALSYDQLRPEDSTDVTARKALANAACLAPGEPIPRALLMCTLKLSDSESLQGEDAVQRLTSLGLLKSEKYGALRLHRLLAVYVGRLGGGVQVVDGVVDLLLAESGRIIDAGYPLPMLGWEVHIRWMAQQAAQRNSLQAGKLYSCLGSYLKLGRDLSGARAAFEHALKLDEVVLGPNNLDVATDARNLGRVLWSLGELAGAREVWEQLLKIDEAVYGPDQPASAQDIRMFGRLLEQQGNLPEARAVLERALKMDKAPVGPDSAEVGEAVYELGLLLFQQRDLVSARTAYERALIIGEAALGPNHANIARYLRALGSLLQYQGDLAGARTAFERALKIDEAAPAIEQGGARWAQLDLARDLSNLGLVLRDQADLAGARSAYERALNIEEAALDPFSPELAETANSLGIVLRELGELAEARKAFIRALKIDEALLGPNDPTTKAVRKNLMAWPLLKVWLGESVARFRRR